MNCSIVPCDGENRGLAGGSSSTTIELVSPEPAGPGEAGGGGVSSGVSVVGSMIGVITSGAVGSVGGAVAAGSVVGVGSVTGGIGTGSGVGSVGGAVVAGSVVRVGSVGSVVGVGSTGSVPVEVSTGSVAVEVPSSATVEPSPAETPPEVASSVAVVSSVTVANSARASAAKPKIQRSTTLNATVVQRPSLGTITPLAASRETDAKLDNRSFPPPLQRRWWALARRAGPCYQVLHGLVNVRLISLT
jgi:hypothetical protein